MGVKCGQIVWRMGLFYINFAKRKSVMNVARMDLKRYKDKVYDIIGAAMSVHRELRWGLLEPIYNEAMHIELSRKGVAHEREVLLPCYYKGQLLEKYYMMDLVAGEIIVELKSTAAILPAHRFQLFNYMRLTQKPIGLLINFGQSSLYCERYAYNKETNDCVLLDKEMDLVSAENEP